MSKTTTLRTKGFLDEMTTPVLSVGPANGCRRCHIYEETISRLMRLDKSEFELSSGVRRNVITAAVHIQKAVCSEFGIVRPEILSRSKNRNVVMARHIAMYLVSKIVRVTLDDMAVLFNRSEHSTIYFALRQIEKAMASYPKERANIEKLQAELAKQLERVS